MRTFRLEGETLPIDFPEEFPMFLVIQQNEASEYFRGDVKPPILLSDVDSCVELE